MIEKHPLYNSRIIRNYLEYLGRYYPGIDTGQILEFSEMSSQEIRDPSHWFTQEQVNRFHEVLNAATGSSDLARDVGRYVVSSSAFGNIKAYLFGLLNPLRAYEILGRIAGNLTRSSDVTYRKLDRNRIELTFKPRDGITEEPFQCENRMGSIESLGTLYTDAFAKVTHDECIHRGGNCCSYIVTLERTADLMLKRIRNALIFTGFLISIALIFILPCHAWLISVVLFLVMLLIISLRAGHMNRNRLSSIIKEQTEALEDLSRTADMQYSNALLVQEIGQAASVSGELGSFAAKVTTLLEEHFDFGRGAILMGSGTRGEDFIITDFGFTPEQAGVLHGIRLCQADDGPDSPLSIAFREKKPFVFDHADPACPELSDEAIILMRRLGTRSCLCVPIVYEQEALGIIYLDNRNARRPILKSDLNLIMGIASQTALFITNQRAIRRIIENEERYRAIFENTGTATIIIERDRTISLVNSRFEALSGYSREEVEGKCDWSMFVAEENIAWMSEQHNIRRLNPENASVNYEFTFITRQGERRDILLTINMIPGTTQSVASLLDITKRKRAEGAVLSSLKEKETLLKEIHHRVKNNMQIVTSLLGLESSRMQDEKDRNVFLGSIDRVRAMAQVHERLYRSDNLSLIDFGDYIRDLINDIAESYHSDSRQVSVSISTDDIHLDVDRAIPCGLIVNELITNSFRHAFDAVSDGIIEVSLSKVSERGIVMTVRDNGPGFSENLISGESGSLGLQLVTMLTQQLKGFLEYNGESGASFTIRF